MIEKLTRRHALGSLVLGAGGSPLLPGLVRAEAATPAAKDLPQGVCVLTPQAVEGPYYFDPSLVRADITEGRPGAAMKLTLKIVEMGSCRPIANVRVDVWHADAGGVYSGYARQGDNRDISTKGQTYLRGTQITDGGGLATFDTIYPGWYPGRTPHIHVKAFLDRTTLLTGQIYFPDDLTARLYRDHDPYALRPNPDTTNATDGIFRQGQEEGGGIVLTMGEEGRALLASLAIGVDPSGAAAKGKGGFGLLRGLFGE
jgi:protocatechuate 3,4-dioxygenase beta subunit